MLGGVSEPAAVVWRKTGVTVEEDISHRFHTLTGFLVWTPGDLPVDLFPPHHPC